MKFFKQIWMMIYMIVVSCNIQTYAYSRSETQKQKRQQSLALILIHNPHIELTPELGKHFSSALCKVLEANNNNLCEQEVLQQMQAMLENDTAIPLAHRYHYSTIFHQNHITLKTVTDHELSDYKTTKHMITTQLPANNILPDHLTSIDISSHDKKENKIICTSQPVTNDQSLQEIQSNQTPFCIIAQYQERYLWQTVKEPLYKASPYLIGVALWVLKPFSKTYQAWQFYIQNKPIAEKSCKFAQKNESNFKQAARDWEQFQQTWYYKLWKKFHPNQT